MRLAVFSDIHGNVAALDAVLADIAREGVDAHVCLGDIVAFGPRPLEVVERLRALENCLLVRGNTERWLGLIKDDPEGRHEEKIVEKVKPALLWTIDQLPADVLSSLRELPPEGTLGDDGSLQLVFEHAAPGSDMIGLQPLTSQEDLDEIFDGFKGQGFFCGHTHKPFVRRVKDRVLIVNDGSVGLPYDEIPRPSWVFVEVGQEGLRAAMKRVDYDRAAVLRDIKERKMEWSDVISRRIETATM